MLRRVLPMLLLCSAALSAQAAEVTYDLRIENGRVAQNMRLIRVKQNDVVKLRWHADKRTEIHLHGYDVSKIVEQLYPDLIEELIPMAEGTVWAHLLHLREQKKVKGKSQAGVWRAA